MGDPIDVNIEIWMVLGSLLEIKNNANAFNNWTVDLLKVVKAKLTELLDEVKSMPLNAIDSWNNEFKLMQCVDENKFEFQRFLFCRICGIHFGITKSDIQVHLDSKRHSLNLIELENSNGRSSCHRVICVQRLVECLPELKIVTSEERMIQNNDVVPEELIIGVSKLYTDTAAQTEDYDVTGDTVEQNNETEDLKENAKTLQCVETDELCSSNQKQDVTRKRKHPISDDLNEKEMKSLRLEEDVRDGDLNGIGSVLEDEYGKELLSVVSYEAFVSYEMLYRKITSQQFINESIQARLEAADRLKTADYSPILDELRRTLGPITSASLKTYVFGSRIYGVGMDASDLNILLDFGDYYNDASKSISRHRMSNLSALTMKALAKRPLKWSKVQLGIGIVKYPIVKAIYKYGIRCNLIFGGCTSVATAQYLASVLDKQPKCHQIILYLQKWQREIKNIHPDSFCFSNYVLTLLVVIFFQTKGLLPRISELQTKKLSACGGFLVCKTLNEFRKADSTLENYLCDFFELYGGAYDPDVHILSAYCGELIPFNINRGFMRKAKLECLKSQYSKSTDCNHKMWMQDIFRTDYNATQAVTVDELNCFQMVCLTSAQFLKKTMELNS